MKTQNHQQDTKSWISEIIHKQAHYFSTNFHNLSLVEVEIWHISVKQQIAELKILEFQCASEYAMEKG